MITMIKSSCGDMIAVRNIDVIGEVKETIILEPAYKKVFKWWVPCGKNEVKIGYEFVIHTCGGSYYWINKETKEECEKIRNMVIRGISGCEETI